MYHCSFYDCSPSSFGLLFILFVIALELNDRNKVNWAEAVFMIYALGFTLEKLAAMQEHGVKGTPFPTCFPFSLLLTHTPSSLHSRNMGTCLRRSCTATVHSFLPRFRTVSISHLVWLCPFTMLLT